MYVQEIFISVILKDIYPFSVKVVEVQVDL